MVAGEGEPILEPFGAVSVAAGEALAGLPVAMPSSPQALLTSQLQPVGRM